MRVKRGREARVLIVTVSVNIIFPQHIDYACDMNAVSTSSTLCTHSTVRVMGSHRRSVVESRGAELVMWTWLPERLPADAPKANVVIFHGLGGHGRFPSVSIAAELLVSHGHKVSAVDFPGHGESPGLNGYIESADALIIDGINAAQAALRESYTGCPLFLLGSSMGGAIAVEVAAALAAMEIGVAGLVLLAPMLAPAAGRDSRSSSAADSRVDSAGEAAAHPVERQ